MATQHFFFTFSKRNGYNNVFDVVKIRSIPQNFLHTRANIFPPRVALKWDLISYTKGNASVINQYPESEVT